MIASALIWIAMSWDRQPHPVPALPGTPEFAKLLQEIERRKVEMSKWQAEDEAWRKEQEKFAEKWKAWENEYEAKKVQQDKLDVQSRQREERIHELLRRSQQGMTPELRAEIERTIRELERQLVRPNAPPPRLVKP